MTGGWKWSKKKDKMGRAKGITKEQTVTGFYTYIKLILQILGSMSVRSTPNPKKAKHTTFILLVSIHCTHCIGIFWGLKYANPLSIFVLFSPTLCTFSIWWMDILNLDLFQSTSIFIFHTFSIFSWVWSSFFLVCKTQQKKFKGMMIMQRFDSQKTSRSSIRTWIGKGSEKSLHWSFSSFGTERDKFHSIPLSQIQQHYKLQA